MLLLRAGRELRVDNAGFDQTIDRQIIHRRSVRDVFVVDVRRGITNFREAGVQKRVRHGGRQSTCFANRRGGRHIHEGDVLITTLRFVADFVREHVSTHNPVVVAADFFALVVRRVGVVDHELLVVADSILAHRPDVEHGAVEPGTVIDVDPIDERRHIRADVLLGALAAAIPHVKQVMHVAFDILTRLRNEATVKVNARSGLVFRTGDLDVRHIADAGDVLHDLDLGVCRNHDLGEVLVDAVRPDDGCVHQVGIRGRVHVHANEGAEIREGLFNEPICLQHADS